MLNEEKIKNNYLKHEKLYSKYASFNKDAIRINKLESDIRGEYARDIDRIIHALSYTRYLDKTQVFSYKDNDHISKRSVHVQFVSKIARTICRALNLNEDLAEAISLGHDIGHTPLGHFGEEVLNEISKEKIGEYFAHNIQSVRQYLSIENNGEGLNLTIQVLDGIMNHNGELLENMLKPINKTKEEFLEQYNSSYNDIKLSKKNRPMTLEACVVRISDIIGYIGRDIEDAINLGLHERENIPEEITSILGNTNKDIINTLILDIIENSLGKDYIAMSEEVYKSLYKLKEYNYENIYMPSLSKEEQDYYKNGMKSLYKKYINDIKNNNQHSVIYINFLNKQNDIYIKNTSDERKVIDFIAGMTDDFFKSEIEKN